MWTSQLMCKVKISINDTAHVVQHILAKKLFFLDGKFVFFFILTSKFCSVLFIVFVFAVFTKFSQ
jgi:hypothetical protein